ncbi:MAG: LacI family DNA-binding transcriptional regulator [Lachnospiraceae bacterium]|nr:LacI family DNA-binding transcriptional regulator [Lachnospiraceae bacterium]
MADRVTIQDIADELGVSRNTVSKAINNTGLLAEATRERVLKKAIEMGYKQFSYAMIYNSNRPEVNYLPETAKREISLFTSNSIGSSHFASTMLDKFQRELSGLGFSFTMHRIQKHELESLSLPNTYNKERTAGIICVEMFNRDYCYMLCDLDLPTLFVDTPVIDYDKPLKSDCLYMDNQTNICCFVWEMIRRGKKKIGFIGDIMHCQSFYERFLAYRNSMYLAGLSCSEEYCIIKNRQGIQTRGYEPYRAYLKEQIQKLKELPDVFICANDFVAVDIMNVFRELGISVPQDIYLCGFDDSPESKVTSPTLTTIHIHSQIMGFSAVHLLMSRIKEPSLNFRRIYTETSLVYRESTED